jgi:hypothetical protein
MRVQPQNPISMTKLERYLTARLINLKNSLNETNPFEQSELYSSLFFTIDEIEFALEVSRKDVVNNMSVESVIVNEENRKCESGLKYKKSLM